ncbi:MAG: tetratricopeptide repeat protein [Planctomycetaceae bacterium]
MPISGPPRIIFAQKQWKEALDYYELSLRIDPELPDAYSGRGNVKLRLDNVAEAMADFEKAYQLDPFSSAAVTGLSYARVRAGRIDDGLKIVVASREDLKQDPTFLYNAACVYAQAWEQAEKQTGLPDREQRLSDYRRQALEDLKQSIARGFSDFDWMQHDPDLASLRFRDPEYKKLLGDRPTRISDDPLAPPVPDSEEEAE